MAEYTVTYCANRMEWATTEEEYLLWQVKLQETREAEQE